jgi:WD40 repeat protein
MAISDSEANIYLLETPNLSPVRTYKISGDMSVYLSMSEDGNYFVSGGNKLYLFHKNSSTPMWTYDPGGHIDSAQITENGKYIIAGSSNNSNNGYEVSLFTRENSTPVWSFSAKDAIKSVRISKNGEYIAALSRNYWVYLFNKSSPEPLWRYRLDGYPTTIYDYGLDMSSEGKYIVAGGRYNIYLFDRDKVNSPKLIISGYDLSFMFLIMGLISMGLFTIYLKDKKD